MQQNGELGKIIPSLARRAIEYYLKEWKIPFSSPGLPPYLINERRGVFVSLKREENYGAVSVLISPNMKI